MVRIFQRLGCQAHLEGRAAIGFGKFGLAEFAGRAGACGKQDELSILVLHQQRRSRRLG
jgi:hypothetical protein